MLESIAKNEPDLFATHLKPSGLTRKKSRDSLQERRSRSPQEKTMADVSTTDAAEEAEGRRRQMLRTAFGPSIAAALADPTVIEVMVNPGWAPVDRPQRRRPVR